MALKLKGSTSGFVALDSPAVAGNNTITLPDSNGSANQVWANDNTAGVTTYTQVTINRNGDIVTPGTISIGGTLTYEDVTNVDVVGLVTAAQGVRINGGGLSIIGVTTGFNSSGISTFTAGVGIADSIFHTGDTNTAIRFPSADTFTVETGGSERIRVDSGGRLVIGTTDIDPVSDGEVPKLISKGTDSTAGAAFVRHSADTGGCGIYLAKSRNATIGSNTIVQDDDELGRITFSGDDGTDLNTQGAQIAAHVDGTPGANDMPGRLQFYTTADGAASVTERMRIDSTGKVAIGNASPQQLLHVWPDTANTTSAYVRVTAGDRNSGTGIDLGHDASGNGHVNMVSNGNLTLSTNNSARLFIKNTGEIGIGTEAPYANGLLHCDGNLVLTASSNAPKIIFDEFGTGTDPKAQIAMDQTDSTNASLIFYTEGGGTLSERYRIKADGKHTWCHPMVFAYAPATTQSLTDATWTKNTWLTSEDIDTDSAFASSTFTVPSGKPGTYYVSAGNNLYGNDNNIRNARTAIYKNGSIYARAHQIVMSTTSSNLRHIQCVTSCIMDLAAGDTIENYMYLDVESGLLYMSSDNDTVRANFLMVYRIG